MGDLSIGQKTASENGQILNADPLHLFGATMMMFLPRRCAYSDMPRFRFEMITSAWIRVFASVKRIESKGSNTLNIALRRSFNFSNAMTRSGAMTSWRSAKGQSPRRPPLLPVSQSACVGLRFSHRRS
jgi:hypothetical protein